MVSIGMGWPAAAADFREEFNVPFPILVDHSKETYRALELARGTPWQIFGPPVWLRAVRSFVSGHGMTPKPKQDPFQLGGVIVVDRGGDVRYSYASKTSSDNPPSDDVIAALP